LAYPGSSVSVKEAISRAVELSAHQDLRLKQWENLSILGFKIDDLVRDQITDTAALVADITYPNHNVFYEIGFALALGKPIVPTVNTAIIGAVAKVQSIGLFDTTGWLPYENGEDLSEKLRKWQNVSWYNRYDKKRDQSQPLFILDTLKKTDFRNHIVSAVNNAHVQYRIFVPEEVPRLTAAQSIADVSASAGVILPIIADDIVGSELHNLRAAFLLGLAHGYDIDALAIQYDNGPAPLDYRDFITNSTSRRETERHVDDYAKATLILNQKLGVHRRRIAPGLLGRINLGASFAEGETQTLELYFVETAEFARAMRAEAAVVVGRKGSGKSAVFQRVVERKSKDKGRCVVDLRPASHNLSELREGLLNVVQAGLFDHTVAAFWQYILYFEVLLKIREMVLPKSKNDFKLQQIIREIEDRFSLTDDVVAGDFTSRLEDVVRLVLAEAKRSASATELRETLTNRLFEGTIPKLRDAVISLSDHFTDILVLIDDLDKGWPPRRVEAQDVNTIKHLIESLNKIHRDLGRKKIELRHLVFLRSDIYERLVEQTSDRGKYNVIKVDWSDSEQLRHLIWQRVASEFDENQSRRAWDAINPKIGEQDAVAVMIDHSLRRPRFLIDLCERVISFAVNRGHDTVTDGDVQDGVKQMSLVLVSDFAYELRDVAGTPEDLFYHFIGAKDLMTASELTAVIDSAKIGLPVIEAIDLLVWYGFIGIVAGDKPTFIYDRAYDFRRLEAEKPKDESELLYAVNPAFLVGLSKG
jgi:Cdc6-like AAA superfamily ATPase